jgi:hypothetical protein
MYRKRRSRTLAAVRTANAHKQNRVIARALLVTACVGLASWANAATRYADKTDRELTELAAGWEALAEDQRRALLTEIKLRMHANSDKHPVLTIQTERRYGRIVRQPDGSLVRIETTEHVVRYQALPEDAGDRPFGLGFEQRVVAGGTPPAAGHEAPATTAAPANPPPAQAPVIQVGNPHRH